MTTHAFCDACLLEKNCYADELWQQKFLQNMVQHLQKFLLPELICIAIFSSKHASQNACVVIAWLVAALNTI